MVPGKSYKLTKQIITDTCDACDINRGTSMTKLKKELDTQDGTFICKEEAQLLMKHKPDINAQIFDGGTALYFSAFNGNMDITRLLLENNADYNISIHSKQSITDTMNNHPSITLDKKKQYLFDILVKHISSHVTEHVSKKSLDYAFDVEAGSSPLHIACFMDRINVVRCLIDYSANSNMTKGDGTTPIFYACEVGHEDIVRVLLDNRADAQICRIDEKSPSDIATDNGHTSIVMIVTEHMKKKKQFPL
ncbi:26S proteasome non-ATPase regulatory subunit 10-like [Mytilus californianus]|uniref:26S proteasome non-ATPase regulatory subunit 10-like n=1 Tax=Mytilus californianus TaxID=6549 RepID=UPI002245E66E|nr:26S proteasome non-ATPase regulatory subunit 10-like [Mytilus californianus]